MKEPEMEIRSLEKRDPEAISAAFTEIGWSKPVAQYQRYLEEQKKGSRNVLVALVKGNIAGYVTIRWLSDYEPFHEDGIPEVKDLNVLPAYRRQGIGTLLMDRAEERISERSSISGIGVGMYPDYGNAQRMYVLRGYVHDGRGLTYRCMVLDPMENTVNDDDLVLYFTKTLR
jgi:ribosomal protein S18 acetylase RimI-like enzyme